MKKEELLALEKNAHLSVGDVQRRVPDLGAAVKERLEARARRAVEDIATDGSESLRTLVKDVAVPVTSETREPLSRATLSALRARVETHGGANRDQLRDEIEKLEKVAEAAPLEVSRPEITVGEAIGLEIPVALHPDFARDLAMARLYRLSDAAGVPDDAARVLADEVGDIGGIKDDRLGDLVAANKLTDAQARKAGVAASLWHILDERPELVAAAVADVADPRELARKDVAAWTKLVEQSGVTPPGGLSPGAYAEVLEAKVDAIFPADALTRRLRTINAADARVRFAFPGMDIAEVLDDATRSDAERRAEVGRRVGLVDRFLVDNPGALAADLTPRSPALAQLRFPAQASANEKTQVLSTVRTYQRGHALTHDIADTTALVAGGFTSAVSVAMTRPEAVAARTGLSASKAEAYHASAREIATAVAAHATALLDIAKSRYGGWKLGTIVTTEIEDYLKELPGFSDLFGSQDFCRCEHCQSILGPAAYFVDLMRFTDRNITQPHFAAKPNHPLKLQNRRPDLWTLQLTCENTNKPIPYLVIINEILENAVAREAGFAGNFADRTAVGVAVYRNTLPTRVNSFSQPFHLPVAELRTYLRHFERTLADLGESGGASGDALARLRLSLAPMDFQLITQPDDAMASLRRVYGIAFNEAGGSIDPINAQRLLKPMSVTRDELGALLASRFVTANGAVPIVIRSEKQSVQSVQNDIENVRNLTRAALDRLHRFVRLWRATKWGIGELDLVLTHLAPAAATLDGMMARAVARVYRVHARAKVSLEELVGLFSLVPQHAAALPTDAAAATPLPATFPLQTSPRALLYTPLFDRLFNPARFVEASGAYPQPGTTFLHPALAAAPGVSDPHLHRLKAATGTDEDALYQLIVGLSIPLGINPASGNDADKRFALSHANLSLLWRHARLARMIQVSVAELLTLVALTPEIPLGYVATIDHLEALMRFHAWWKTTRWSLRELVEIRRPGLPAIATSAAAVAATAAATSVTYVITVDGGALPAETVTFAANGTLQAVVADWNGQAQHTSAYRSDTEGTPSPAGTFLSIRTNDSTAGVRVTITADASGLFAAAVPRDVAGRPVQAPGAAAAQPPEQVAADIVGAVVVGRTLVFADTVFALIPPTAPTLTSAAAVAGTAAGEAVTYSVALHGRPEAPETITFHGNATLDAAIADWNAQARTTEAYRSEAAGAASAAGDRLSVRVKGAAGSDTSIALTADAAGRFGGALPRTTRGVHITEEQSRAIIAANLASVEQVSGEGQYRLAANFDPTAVLVVPAGVDARFEPQLRDALAGYHGARVLLSVLPGRVAIAPERVTSFVALLGADLSTPQIFGELRGEALPAHVALLIGALRRLALLFAQDTVFDAVRLGFVQSQAALFGIARFDRLGADAVRRVEQFRALLAPRLGDADSPPDLGAALAAFDPVARFANADQVALARVLGCDVALLQSVAAHVPLASTPFEALEAMGSAIVLARALGIGGEVFGLVQSVAYDDLAQASAGVQAAFRTKYEDEAEWAQKVEPFRDAVLSRQRDGLVPYLVHSAAAPFDEVNDLFHYYLLDVELEGCARTSRVAAAIDSVQLYVQRCLMNLEETPVGAADPVHVLPQSIPPDEWEWRQHYRIWEVNRKIFLFPQANIEPELRDDKTQLFREFEEQLFSKEITEETILEAYSRYLRGFDELSHLTIAGTYHEKDEAAQRDVLHMLGVTADEPPVYYYRRVENAEYGVANDARVTHWASWEKINVQIPVRKVSPLVFQGQLYAFWIRYVTKSTSEVKDGTSRFTGYHHRAFVEFTRRRVDGTWTAPQKLTLAHAPFNLSGEGVILDPIVPKSSTTVPILWFNMTLYRDFQPLYDDMFHEFPKEDYTLKGFMWDQVYPGAGSEEISIRGANFQMWSPIDLYRLRIGPRYEYDNLATTGVPWLNPAIFILIWLLSGGNFDLTSLLPQRLVWSRVNGGRRQLYRTPSGLPCFDTYAYGSILLDEARIAHFERPMHARTTQPQWAKLVTDYLRTIVKENPIADTPADTMLDVVNGSVGDVIIQTSGDALYLQENARPDGKYHLRRLRSTVSSDIADILYRRGLEALLGTSTQLGLQEHPTGVTLVGSEIEDATATGTLDFSGPMGVYFREIFFHVPFLIANYFNSQGQFEQAQRWYHFVFDPTSSETIPPLAGLSADDQARRQLDRVWRYREFRGVDLQSLREQLTDPAAIEAYRRDPFNPFAISRLRPGAFQKAIVMKYVDNLLDWGDHLFALAFSALNPEFLREATQKYVMAQEILGPRPARVGECGEGAVQPKTYPGIVAALAAGSEFLMEVESLVAVRYRTTLAAGDAARRFLPATSEHTRRETRRVYASAGLEQPALAAAANGSAAMAAGAPELVLAAGGAGAPGPRALTRGPAFENVGLIRTAPPAAVLEAAAKFTPADAALAVRRGSRGEITTTKLASTLEELKVYWIPSFTIDFITEVSPAFCIPSDKRMLAYWDRVDDRLYKLRHCMDVDGVVRQLPLFAAEIDPGLLLRARAAGLSLEDVLAASGGALPPYRFQYLLDKARQYAAAVQGLGAALLASLERRDAEELVRIRNTHQKNVLALTDEVRRQEVRIAVQGVEIAGRRKVAAEYRRDYYAGLVASGLTGAEVTQEVARVSGAVLKGVASIADTVSAIAHLVPQVGSPFSMKYGGLEIGMSATSWAQLADRLADGFESTAIIAGIVAGYERREQGWEHQEDLAKHDVRVAERELVVAEIRQAIAERASQLHETVKEQHVEVMEFYDRKFSNLGLFVYLSRSLQQLHREAYNNALAMARLAERAYKFERPDDETPFVGGEWDGSRSGLHAGERLLAALQRMERRFIETNDRPQEINQSFSVAQIDPEAVITLKETGACEFALPELYFDLFYPGQYRRRIRAVRLTIPCITGPYTNVSARMTLLRSHIRREPLLGADHLFEVPRNHTVSVATSTGQGDSGVFDLSFRDERLMPFEGAGAISEWRLELPAHFRPFDYQTINDVILNVSYSAEENTTLRQVVDSLNAAVEGSLVSALSGTTMTRAFSLRQEFSAAFNRIVHANTGTPVTIDVTDRHLPLFLRGKGVAVTGADLVLVTEGRDPVGASAFTVNGVVAAGFADPSNPPDPAATYGGLSNQSITAAFGAGLRGQHTIVATNAGALAGAGPGATVFDVNKLRDILLVVNYRLQ